MPRHHLEIELPPKVVLNSDVVFTVRSDGQKLGELLVSRGSLAWLPVHVDDRPYHLSWERLDELMRDHGRRRPAPRTP